MMSRLIVRWGHPLKKGDLLHKFRMGSRNPNSWTSGRNIEPESLEVIVVKITKDIKPVTFLKANAAALLEQVNETHRPVVIMQNGEPKAVRQDPQSFENMRNALGILKLISQGEEDIKKRGGLKRKK